MAVDFDSLDYSDPCAVLTAIRPAYYQLVAGQAAQSVTFTAGNGTQKMVTFHRADLSRLSSLISTLEQQCAAASGRRRRFAVRTGGHIR